MTAKGSDGKDYPIEVRNDSESGQTLILTGPRRIVHIGGGKYQLDGENVFFDNLDLTSPSASAEARRSNVVTDAE
jgi:hypothetical protein